MGRCAALSLHVRQKVFGELFAQLHSPLVEGVYVPDGALDEHFMFI